MILFILGYQIKDGENSSHLILWVQNGMQNSRNCSQY